MWGLQPLTQFICVIRIHSLSTYTLLLCIGRGLLSGIVILVTGFCPDPLCLFLALFTSYANSAVGEPAVLCCDVC